MKREQIIFILNIIRRRQESGLGISFIDSYHGNTRAVKLQKYKGRPQETVKHNTRRVGGGGGGVRGVRTMVMVMVMVTLFIHGKSFSNDIKKDKRLTNYT